MKLIDQVRQKLRVLHYAYRTEQSYVRWIEQFIRFHIHRDLPRSAPPLERFRHPRDMGAPEVVAFLTYLAVARRVAVSTQNQALNALVFLYTKVLDIQLGPLEAVRAQRPARLPVVMSRAEVRSLLFQLPRVAATMPVYSLMARLLYGTGLRRIECCRLRVHDVDLERRLLTVRGGKGDKDRTVTIPVGLIEELRQQRRWREQLHQRDLDRGVARVELPDALERKYPQAAREFGWQFLFASGVLSHCPRTQRIGRHHLHEEALQRAVRKAARAAGITKHVGCHTFRHSYATHLLEMGYDIRTVQQVLGHKDVRTTMMYTHVLDQNVIGVRSPLDGLELEALETRGTPEKAGAR